MGGNNTKITPDNDNKCSKCSDLPIYGESLPAFLTFFFLGASFAAVTVTGDSPLAAEGFGFERCSCLMSIGADAAEGLAMEDAELHNIELI